MGRLSWTIWVGPNYDHLSPHKIETEGYWTDRRVGGNMTVRTEIGADATTGRGMQTGTRSWRR